MDPNETPVVVEPPAPLTAEAIGAAVAAGLAQQQQQQRESAPVELTPEQRRAFFQEFDPMANGFVDQFSGVFNNPDSTAEERAKAIADMRDGFVNQAVRGSELLIEDKLKDIRKLIEPLAHQQQQQQQEAMWAEFATRYPDMANQRALVDAMSISLSQQGFTPKNLDEAFTRVYAVSRDALTNAGAVLPPTTTPPAGTMPRMAATGVAQGGNTGNPRQAQPAGVAGFFAKKPLL